MTSRLDCAIGDSVANRERTHWSFGSFQSASTIHRRQYAQKSDPTIPDYSKAPGQVTNKTQVNGALEADEVMQINDVTDEKSELDESLNDAAAEEEEDDELEEQKEVEAAAAANQG